MFGLLDDLLLVVFDDERMRCGTSAGFRPLSNRLLWVTWHMRSVCRRSLRLVRSLSDGERAAIPEVRLCPSSKESGTHPPESAQPRKPFLNGRYPAFCDLESRLSPVGTANKPGPTTPASPARRFRSHISVTPTNPSQHYNSCYCLLNGPMDLYLDPRAQRLTVRLLPVTMVILPCRYFLRMVAELVC